MEPGHWDISVRRQCELLGVNRSGLYYQPLGESAENLKLMRLIDEEYTRRPFYGSRRDNVGAPRAGAGGGPPPGTTADGIAGTGSRLPQAQAEPAWRGTQDLSVPVERGGYVTRVNQVWSTDITYIRMAEGFVYLVAVTDWFSRFVLSWALSLTIEVDFCLDALGRALRRGRPEIFKSDQGSQFKSEKFTGVLTTWRRQCARRKIRANDQRVFLGARRQRLGGTLNYHYRAAARFREAPIPDEITAQVGAGLIKATPPSEPSDQ